MLTRRTVILTKREVTYGTDPAMTGSDGVLAFEVDLDIKGEVLERPVVRDTLSQLSHVIGLREVSLTFKTELKGGGVSGTNTVLPEIDDLLTGCAFGTAVEAGTSQTYSLVSSEANMNSIAIKIFKDGNLHKILGARGTVKFNLEAGQFGNAEWEFQGLYSAVLAATLPNMGGMAGEALKPPVVYNSSFQISGFSPVCSALMVDLANNVVRREDINAATGVDSFRISERKPKMEFRADAVVESSNPFWGDWAGSVVDTFGVTIGTSPGNKILFTGIWETETNKYADADGISVYDVAAALCSSDNGSENDELTIKFV